MAINTWPSSPASNSHRGASFVETVLLNVPCATKSLPLHQSVSWMGLYHTPLSFQTLALESASEMALHHKRVLIAVSKVKIMLQWANYSTFFRQGSEILNDMDPFLKSLANEVQECWVSKRKSHISTVT